MNMWKIMKEPKWIGFHLLTLIAFLTCIQLGFWQWDRRHRVDEISNLVTFSSRSFIYAFQWWCFAAFVIWFWHKFFKDEYLVRIGKLERNENEKK